MGTLNLYKDHAKKTNTVIYVGHTAQHYPLPVSCPVSYDTVPDCHNFVKWFPAQHFACCSSCTHANTNTDIQLRTCFALSCQCLLFLISLPSTGTVGQGRRSSYSFLIKLSLCHPGPQSHGGGDCWQENEAYECVRSASDRFMGHQCQHIVEEN